MKNKKLFFACLLIIALSLGLTGFAQNNQPFGPRPGPPHNPMEFVLRNLDLNREQKEKIHSIFAAQQPAIRAILDSDFSNHEKLHELIENGSFDLPQVKAIAENLAANKISLLVEKQRSDSQIYNVLTQEQQTKFDQIKGILEQRKPMELRENRENKENKMLEMLTSRLDLSINQQTQVQNILAMQKEAFNQMSKLKEFHEQLATLTSKGHFDEVQIRTLSQQYLPTMVNMIVAHTTTNFNIYSVLTDEQKKAFLELPFLSGPPRPDAPFTPGHRMPRN